MLSTSFTRERLPLVLAMAAAVAGVVSIAASAILLSLAFAALLLSGEKMRLPPIKLPLGLFVAGTILSLAFSADPMAGRPQIRKFFVFLILLVLYSTLKQTARVRTLVLWWALGLSLSSLLSFRQFYVKMEHAKQLGLHFYNYYMEERITGFPSHWMTLGGEQMIGLLLVAAFLFFSPARRRWAPHLLAAGAIIAGSLLLGYTRSIWLATAVAGCYLLWFWRRWVILLVPVVLALLIVAGPASLRTRATSIFKPRGDVDSNQFRIICWRTGWNMIRSHPILGLGPEGPKYRFNDYIPPDVPRPLPSGWYGHLHNIYFQYAAERGIPTMLCMMWMLGKILYDFVIALRRAPPGLSDERFVLHGSIAVMIGILLAGIFEYNLGDSEVLFLFLAVVACGYTAYDRVMEPVVD